MYLYWRKSESDKRNSWEVARVKYEPAGAAAFLFYLKFYTLGVPLIPRQLSFANDRRILFFTSLFDFGFWINFRCELFRVSSLSYALGFRTALRRGLKRVNDSVFLKAKDNFGGVFEKTSSLGNEGSLMRRSLFSVSTRSVVALIARKLENLEG